MDDYTLSFKEFEISTSRSRLQPRVIWTFLHDHSTWARGIPFATVLSTLDHSLNFGAYIQSGAQIGFARVVTDYGQFAYLCDVFVLPAYRRRGLGKALVQAVMNHSALAHLRRFALDTEDAYQLYAQFGFTPLAHSNRHMEILHEPLELWPMP